MNARRNVQQIRETVAKYRELARMIADPDTARRILELTDELSGKPATWSGESRHSRCGFETVVPELRNDT